MRRAALLTAALLLALPFTACSSASGPEPAYRLPALKLLLVSASDVSLPGFTRTAPDGAQQARTTTATVYFNHSGFTDSGITSSDVSSQLSVALVSTGSASAARASMDAAVTTAAASLRGAPTTTVLAVGGHGHEVAGRTKGDGTLQRGAYFVEGDVAVSVVLSSSTGPAAAATVEGVARAEDAKLRKAA